MGAQRLGRLGVSANPVRQSLAGGQGLTGALTCYAPPCPLKSAPRAPRPSTLQGPWLREVTINDARVNPHSGFSVASLSREDAAPGAARVAARAREQEPSPRQLPVTS